MTLGYVPGGTPAKWARIWAERHRETPLVLHAVTAAGAADAVRAGTVDVALLRLPADTTGLAVIALYEETTVAVVPTDHVLTAADEIAAADLDGEPMVAEHWRQDLVDWVVYRALNGADAEMRNEQKAAAAAEAFESKTGRLPSANEVRLWGVSPIVGTLPQYL